MTENIEKIKSVLKEKYEIERLINEGGMGEIYLGVHRALEKQVAIKIVHQEMGKDKKFRERFYREAKLAASLDHSGIIDIYDFGSKDDFDYIIMPFIKGPTLQDKIKREGKLEIQDCLRLMISITDAVSYAHKNNVVHRDIKPSNIMIEKQGNVIITDFGISKNLGDVGITTVDTIVGSPKYMCPEQIKGLNVDARCDLYSLGLIFYEMITGKHPFEDKDATSIYYCQAHEMPCRPEEIMPDVPVQIGDMIMKLLEKSPEARYQDGYQLLKDLENLRTSFPKNSRMDIEATLPDGGMVSDGVRTRIIAGGNEPYAEGGHSEVMNGEKKVFRWLIPGLALTLIFIVAILWLVHTSSTSKNITDKKDYKSSTSMVKETKKEKAHDGSLDKAETQSVAKLSHDLDKTQEAGISFDSIVKNTLALGQERDAAFLKLWVNKARFKIGDSISYNFQSEKPCYLLLLNITSEGDLIQVFPNKFSLSQFVQAKKQYTIPGDKTDIALEVTGPTGKEEIVALVAEKPFDLFAASFDGQPFFRVAKEGKALFDKIAKKIQIAEKLNLAQKRLTYSIVD